LPAIPSLRKRQSVPSPRTDPATSGRSFARRPLGERTFLRTTDAEANKQIKGAGIDDGRRQVPDQSRRCSMLAKMGCIVFSVRHGRLRGIAPRSYIVRDSPMPSRSPATKLHGPSVVEHDPHARLHRDSARCRPTRIAVTGASGGGTQTIIISAIDDAPPSPFRRYGVRSYAGGCICENAPLLRVGKTTSNSSRPSLPSRWHECRQ